MAKMAQANKNVKGKPSKKPVNKGLLKTKNPEIMAIIVLVIILALIAFIRIRLLSFPLERDEGEYAYFGQLILHGIPPYKMAYNLKFPGTYYSYALIMAFFGQTIQGIHFGLLLFNLGSLVFLYLITKKLFNSFTALIAVLTCGLLFISPSLLAQAAHATHFVTFYMLVGTYLLMLGMEKNKLVYYLFSGIMMGLAFIMKQSGLFFSVFGGIILILNYFINKPGTLTRSLLNLIIYGVGVCIPAGITFLLMAASGVFDNFWFWTFTYPRTYGSRVPLSQAWSNFIQLFPMVTINFTLYWIISGLGIISLFFYKGKKWSRIFLALFLVFSFLNAVPGFYFRNHYFIPVLPAVGILTGLFFETINLLIIKYFKHIRIITAGIFIILVISQLSSQYQKEVFFKHDPNDLCRLIYNGNPFTEAIPVAKYIQANTSEKDRVFVFGSEPEIYFYSQRTSATGYIYMYDLVFEHKFVKQMQKELMQEVEKAKPKYIVFVSCPYSWLAEKDLAEPLFVWFNSYLVKEKFVPVGIADYLFPDPTVYLWNEDAGKYNPKSKTFIRVFRRSDI